MDIAVPFLEKVGSALLGETDMGDTAARVEDARINIFGMDATKADIASPSANTVCSPAYFSAVQPSSGFQLANFGFQPEVTCSVNTEPKYTEISNVRWQAGMRTSRSVAWSPAVQSVAENGMLTTLH